jgi:glycine/D-amino acid oxidase-like deaminating enzyme
MPERPSGHVQGMKLLVLATDPVEADDVRRALGDDDVDGAEVLVVSPAVNESPLAFWVSDSDEAIIDAESTAQSTAAALADAGARTRAQAGESEPLLALQDALTTYRADRVLVFVRGEDSQRYREDDVIGEAERRFGVPVTEVTR